MEPRISNIVTRSEIKAVGMRYSDSFESIAHMWQEFVPRSGEILNSLNNGVFYGFQESGTYIACVEVSSFADVPEGMVTCTIPAGKYAILTYRGIPETLDDSFDDELYGKWLPKAGLEPSADHYVEVYDHRFKPGSEDSEVDLWVPVK